VPVINCNKNDFKINLEIVRHVSDCKIDTSDLYFYDELVQQYSPEKVAEVVIVDHNILDVTQSQFGDKVTRVIDHHVDNNAYGGQLTEKVCRFIGSACSLVAFKFQEDSALFEEDLKDDASQPGLPNLAYLLGAAISLDTYNFKADLKDKKWS